MQEHTYKVLLDSAYNDFRIVQAVSKDEAAKQVADSTTTELPVKDVIRQ